MYDKVQPAKTPPPPHWWRRISEDLHYVPQEHAKIEKRRMEYRLAIEQNNLLTETLQYRNNNSLIAAIDFLWACNLHERDPPNATFLHSIEDEVPDDTASYNLATLTIRLYRRTLHSPYSDNHKRKILDNHLVWLLCRTLKPDLPAELPGLWPTSDSKWDDIWDVTPLAKHIGRWAPMASQYSTTHMGQWIMECERCIFANKAPPSSQDAGAVRRGKAVAVVEIIVNLQTYLIDKYESVTAPHPSAQWDFRDVLKEFFLTHMPPSLWVNAFPQCPRDENAIQSTLAKNMDLLLASLGFIGDNTFQESFKKWFLADTTSGPNSSRFVPPKPLFPDTTVLGMFPEGLSHRSYDFDATRLDAWFINSGRFKLKSTEDLKQHLRLDHSNRTIYVYMGSNTFENGRLALLHDTPIAKAFSLDHLWDELQMTYSLLFGQTVGGKKIGREMIASTNPAYQAIPPIPDNIREDKVLRRVGYLVSKPTPTSDFTFADWGAENRMPRASACPPSPGDFPLFGPRLELLYKQMRADQPRGYLDVLRPGYTDRFTYYTQMFAMIIAVLGILNVILSVLQAVYAGVAYNVAKNLAVQANDLAIQQLNVSIVSLNVSLQQLLLQKAQMNITT